MVPTPDPECNPATTGILSTSETIKTKLKKFDHTQFKIELTYMLRSRYSRHVSILINGIIKNSWERRFYFKRFMNRSNITDSSMT